METTLSILAMTNLLNKGSILSILALSLLLVGCQEDVYGCTDEAACNFNANSNIFDNFRENVHIIADSNHGYKMIGVGKLVAEEVLGEKSKLLEPFRFSRFVEGKLHPTSNSPFPWS